MTLLPDPTLTPISPSDLEDGEVIPLAIGILMVRYQLTHDQARAALAKRAERAHAELRAQAEQIITSQDASIRRWASGPVAGVLDRSRLEPPLAASEATVDATPTRHP